MNRVILCFCLLGWGGVLPAQEVGPSQASGYVVRFDVSALEAVVDGRIRVSEGRLMMGTTGVWALPATQTWTSRVRDLVVRDTAGTVLPVHPDSAHGWIVGDGHYEGGVSLSYVVDLTYTREASDLPRTTTGYGGPKGFFTMTTPLFVHGETEGPFEVEIAIPDGWHLATAWKETGVQGRDFLVPSLEGLVENALVLSQSAPLRVHESDFDIRIGLLGEYVALEKAIQPVVKAQLRAALLMFPHPGPVQHLLVFFPDRWDTGEALEASNVMSSQQAPGLDNVSLWGKTLAHELVHLWNGHMVSGSDWAASQWFSEGATEYLASLTQLRAGVIDENAFFNHMRKHLHLYLLFEQGSVHDDVSLVEAGREKARNNAALYDGGALAGFCFDGMIREATSGERELSDVVTALIENAGPDGYSNEEIIAEIVRLAGEDARTVYDRSVAGTERLPLQACFARYGYHLGINALDVEVHPEANATVIRRLMRISLRTPFPFSW